MFAPLARAALLRRSIPTAAARRGLAGGMPHLPQSSKATLFAGHPTNEGWEMTMLWWYTTSAILLVGILGFAPQTEITVWAKQEAEARLAIQEESGGTAVLEFGKHYQDVKSSDTKTFIDSFSSKAMRMNDDDDDDDDEEDDDDDE
jgi:hypothetical protein